MILSKGNYLPNYGISTWFDGNEHVWKAVCVDTDDVGQGDSIPAALAQLGKKLQQHAQQRRRRR